MLTGWRLALSKLFIIPQRYVFAIMSLLAIANAYTMRVCLNMAITQMVRKTAAVEGDPHYDPDACPDSNAVTVTVNTTEDDITILGERVLFEWSEATQGLLLGAFYYGFVITNIPGGMLAERYGGKWVLHFGLLFTSICTLITPVVTKMGGATALFTLRVLEGMAEGPTIPALMVMVSRWVPMTERARVGTLVFGGAQMGNIGGLLFSGIVLSDAVWDNVFYLFGSLGLVWCACWSVLCYSTPNTHPFISDKEKKFLNENVASLISTKERELDPVPWKALLRSVPVWALIIAGVAHDWGYFTMVTDLPKYMTDVLKFDIKSTGVFSSMPYIAMWLCSICFGVICDFCIKRGYHSILTGRKLYTTISATGPGICILLASYSGCNAILAVMWFIIAMSLMGAYYSGMRINALDITPNYAGTTTALINATAAVSAIASPYLIGLLTPSSTLKQWRIAFWVCLVMMVFSNIVFVIWSQAEPQWWDDVRKYGYPANWKHGPLPTRNTDTETAISENGNIEKKTKE